MMTGGVSGLPGRAVNAHMGQPADGAYYAPPHAGFKAGGAGRWHGSMHGPARGRLGPG